MTTAKTLVDFYDKSREMGPEEAIADEGMSLTTEEIGRYLECMAENGLNGVKNRMSEENAFKVMKIAEGLIVASLACDGNGSFLTLSSVTGELQKYTHSICMSILGIAMDEEWL